MLSNLAYIHTAAQLGENVTVDPFAVIHEDTIIGDNTHIHSHAVIMPGARIGNNCKIFSGAIIASAPQDLKFLGEKTTAEIGDNTTIREFATINRGTKDKMRTVIGKNVLVMAYVHIAHDCIIGNNVILANAVNIAGHVVVGDYAVIGGLAGVHQFVHVGKHSMISGGSLVGKDVPPFSMAARNPLTYMGLNTTGLKRRNFSVETINHIASIYKIVYNGSPTIQAALQKVEEDITPSYYKDEIINFIKHANRGIIKPAI